MISVRIKLAAWLQKLADRVKPTEEQRRQMLLSRPDVIKVPRYDGDAVILKRQRMRAKWEFDAHESHEDINKKIRADFWKALAEQNEVDDGLVISWYRLPHGERIGYELEFNYYAKT